jgi:hypothetical protein
MMLYANIGYGSRWRSKTSTLRIRRWFFDPG